MSPPPFPQVQKRIPPCVTTHLGPAHPPPVPCCSLQCEKAFYPQKGLFSETVADLRGDISLKFIKARRKEGKAHEVLTD